MGSEEMISIVRKEGLKVTPGENVSACLASEEKLAFFIPQQGEDDCDARRVSEVERPGLKDSVENATPTVRVQSSGGRGGGGGRGGAGGGPGSSRGGGGSSRG